jgi:L-fuculose-phosphate aldolase
MSARPPLERLREDLLCAYHVLDLDGQGSGLGGHVSARLPGASTFWCHAWGLAFDEVGIDDLLEVDFALNRRQGRGKVNPTLIFHSRIYAARPEVNCVVHTHADHATVLTAGGTPFAMVTQLAALLHDDLAFLDEYDGLVTADAEGDHLARALGSRRALLLRNHGLISVGPDIGTAVVGALVIEANCAAQLKAAALGPVRALPDAAAVHAKRFLGAPGNTLDRWNMLKRRAARARERFIPPGVIAASPPAPESP